MSQCRRQARNKQAQTVTSLVNAPRDRVAAVALAGAAKGYVTSVGEKFCEINSSVVFLLKASALHRGYEWTRNFLPLLPTFSVPRFP
jgi:hypothetical protein